jgi:7,8-dihydropterin-6-yl-methyl-4-(beta-D-ribofuranosyl)aminobenzene 5'-phosphate synthase
MESHKIRLNEATDDFNEVQFTIVYDCASLVPDLQTGWGFACVVKVGEISLLFDTGGDGEILLQNMNRLKIDPTSIQIVLISHNRFGTVGGLSDFLLQNPNVSVYVPESFPNRIVETILKHQAQVYRVYSFEELQPNIFTLGEFVGFFREQAMAIKTSAGIVVVTGCTHQSIISILKKARNIFAEDPICLAMGGFNFGGLSVSEKINIIKSFKKLKVHKVAVCYYTDNETHILFEEAYRENYIKLGVGGVITINSTCKEKIQNFRQILK